MPNNITDVDTFTAPIQTVADGDAGSGANFALAPQGLANRTLNLKNRLDDIDAGRLFFEATMATATSGGVVPLTIVVNEAGFSLSTNEIVTPLAGYYMVEAIFALSEAQATGTYGINLQNAAVTVAVGRGYVDSFPGRLIHLRRIVSVATPATDRIRFVERETKAMAADGTGTSIVTVTRLGAL